MNLPTHAEMPAQDKRFPLRVIEEHQMGAATDATIRELLCVCFPDDVSVFGKTRLWHGSAPAFSLVHEQKNRVLGHVGIVVRQIRCGSERVIVAGVQNLAVHPELRGSSLSRQLMIEAMSEAKHRGINWGLLFCLPRLEKFYSNLGWRTIHAVAQMDDGCGGKLVIPPKNICMAICLCSIPFPGGNIDLQGADW
jgi:predicted N-acetyltransferase YhbS